MMTSCCHCIALWGSYRLKYTSPFQIILPFGAAKEGKADIFFNVGYWGDHTCRRLSTEEIEHFML